MHIFWRRPDRSSVMHFGCITGHAAGLPRPSGHLATWPGPRLARLADPDNPSSVMHFGCITGRVSRREAADGCLVIPRR
jgi:hypothetical protein